MASGTVPAPVPVFANASMWSNFTMWTAQHFNMSRLAPSLEDLVLAGPRMVMKLGKLGSFIALPDAADGFGQRIVPEATDPSIFQTAAAVPVSSTLAEAAASVPPSGAAGESDPAAMISRFSLEGAKGLGSVFSYATSKWALCCIAMAVILNRTHIFAATRRRLRLRWHVRLALRIVPIILFILQARSLLQSIQCQTSPDFSELRWGNASKSSDLMFSHTNPFLHGLSSTLLFGASDEESCLAVRMIPPHYEEAPELQGSLSLLWPLFGTFCLSQFIEVVSCAVQGRPVAAETGMTLFEHSLAFAEADAAISNQLGWGLFTTAQNANVTIQASGGSIAVTRSMIMRRVNTPAEVLLVAALSALSHITSHVLGIFNLQAKFRLISTGFWGLAFMGSIIWSAATFSIEDGAAQGFLRFPTVCIIGFMPHVLVLVGIIICSFIYLAALFLSALAPPEIAADERHLSLWERLSRAHGNMQANVSLADIRIRMDMDFYTALLRAGFGVITMASEAVYLNEDHRVSLKRHTWLEEERFREIEDLRMQWMSVGVPGSRFDPAGAIGLVPASGNNLGVASGYAREKVAQKVSKNNNRGGRERRIRDGVGAAERSGRWLMALDYLMHINRLAITAWAIAMIKFLAFIGFRNPPGWLRWLSARPKADNAESRRATTARLETQEKGDVMVLADSYRMFIRRVEDVDVEAELRRRVVRRDSVRVAPVPPTSEGEIDNHLYDWFLQGRWWGNVDGSGEFAPPAHEIEDSDFDATSVISATESMASEADWESDEGSDGRRTPTQRSPQFTRESTPLVDTALDMTDLARLLHPQSPEERDEALALAAHLGSEKILTRSGFRRLQQRQRLELLAGNKHGAAARRAANKMTPDEEARALEQILLSRRRAAAEKAGADGEADPGAAGTWETGAAGMGPDGPQCVVCQSVPRTIIVWPCRCLSLCDDCRVSLAMNNFDKCVCCRREVISFSRIYVP